MELFVKIKDGATQARNMSEEFLRRAIILDALFEGAQDADQTWSDYIDTWIEDDRLDELSGLISDHLGDFEDEEIFDELVYAALILVKAKNK